ncbi:MAG TPA: hypothetical protein VMB73_07645 [Acetobacteraceae bacterium]|jgi:hypothetical protein|nr:hypothetical protein [Acetobacteraceae bacterium]
MDDVRSVPGESEAARAARLKIEAQLIAEAEQELAEGKGISGDELKRFFEWFVSGDDKPPPAASDED